MRTVTDIKKQILDLDKLTGEEKTQQIQDLKIDGLPISELGLYFVLPSDENIEMAPNGKMTKVTADNLEHYLEAVVNHYFGISVQT